MATITINHNDLQALLTAAAEAGAARIAAMLSPEADLISQRKAYQLFGRGVVEAWIERGLIRPKRVGEAANSKRLYSRSEMHALATADDTASAIVRRYNTRK
ncbi:MAG: hypothetical protein IJT30_01260 [Muribaculaceae bacterium]|nr:hypothetical protein [Muribaculaceae bacterium]